MELHGYQYSVYSWIARLALAEKGVDHHWTEVNPFAPDVPGSYLALHPFKRVPALIHDGFEVYETGAITRYVDEAFSGPGLQPTDTRHRARASQVMRADLYLNHEVAFGGVGEERCTRPSASDLPSRQCREDAQRKRDRGQDQQGQGWQPGAQERVVHRSSIG